MKILLISDVHSEFHRDCGGSFFDSLPSADVLILAGDITVGTARDKTLSVFGQALANMALNARYGKIAYTPGNHEYYRDYDALWKTVSGCMEYTPGIIEASRNGQVEFTYRGVHFVGATLWYADTPLIHAFKSRVFDSQCIKNWEKVALRGGEADRDFLSSKVNRDSVVFTHMMPSPKCIAPKFAASLLNDYFVHDMEQIIHDEEPQLWLHGHTHDAVDVMVGKTRVFANPFGYPGENPRWEPQVVEIGD